ncbi:MAG TPA: ABC transporter transmembrane domain-containing protein [Herpetosiphonaceae bacterium]
MQQIRARRGAKQPAADTEQKPSAALRDLEWRRLFRYVAPYRWKLALALVTLMASSSIGLLLPISVQWLVDTVAKPSNAGTLNLVALALLGVFILQMVFNFIQSYFISYVGERAIADLRIEAYAHLQRLSLSFFNERRVGEITSRVTNDVTLIQAVTTTSIASLLQNIISFVGSFALMITISWRLTTVSLLIIPLLMALGIHFGRRLRALSFTAQDRLADATAVLEETIAGVRIVQSFAREPHEIGRFTSAIERAFSSSMQRTKTRAQFMPLVSFFGFGSLVLVLWFGGRQVYNGTMTVGGLVAFLMYAGAIAGSLGTFTGIYSQLQEALGATARVFGILDTEPEIADKPGAVALGTIDGRVAFDNIIFSYGDGRDAPVLSDIALEVAPGEVLALVGPSGSGKTTLVNLIPRFYDVSSGGIRIDGHDIRDVQLRSLRSQIGIVPQETLLFGGTINDNIRYGNLEASEEDVLAAARAANAHEFISRFEDGYETLVGERGVKLSGGQRQRVAIARALLKNPRILILDEATSAMDSESEGLVQEALERLMQNRTTFVIAHRLSTIKNASRIAVIEHGRLAEIGTHAELLELGGLYARLYNLQFDNSLLDQSLLA